MNRFFKNQPNRICSHLCEKASKGWFLKPKKLQDHSNERKGKEKKRERGEEEKAMVALLVFIIFFSPKKTVERETAVTFSKIRLDI